MRKTFVAAVVAVSIAASGCGGGAKPTITVGSANFTESIVLAEIFAQALEAKGLPVRKKLNIGAREAYFPALEKGTIDVLPEYTGSLLSFVTKQQETPTSNARATYGKLKDALADKNISVLAMSGAQDKDGIVTNAETADRYHLKRVSDLEPVAGRLIMGGPPECPKRPACLKGLGDVYGVEFEEFKPLDPGGPQTVELLKSDEIQVANLFTTDGRIAQNHFVLLDDDKGISGSENVVAVVRDDVVDAYGKDLSDLLNRVTGKLTTAGLTRLNKRVDIDKEDADAVASDWLESNGFK